MKNMKSLIASIAIVGLVGLAVGVGAQAQTASVAATVTVQNISVGVANGTVVYGTLTAGASNDTTTAGINNTQVATNNGNITEDFNIKGLNSDDWLLKAAPATDNEYKHEFCKVAGGDCDGTPVWTALTTSYQTLTTGVAKDGTFDFDLQITTPDPSTSFVEQAVNVTVQAVTAS